jgi:NAD(P)-dependent dehydrogenase (short-subunit alcohol dehydrogenase family)
MKNFHGKRCLVTGAASGIGRATALALAAEGAQLVVTDVDADGLESLVAQLGAGTVRQAEAFDLTDRDAVDAFADTVHADGGALDVVMNVAGISAWGAVEDVDHDHWQRLVDVDLMGPIHVIEAFVPPMVRGGRGGHLVNVSSAAGLLGLPRHAAYSAAKFGLRGVSEVLRFDLHRHHIGVSLVCPGAVDTPIVQSTEIVGVDREHPLAKRMAEEFREHAVSPEHVAAAILDGVRKRRYLVFTSRDIRAAYALQRWCPPLYVFVMRRLNDRMHRVAAKARVASPPPPVTTASGAD